MKVVDALRAAATALQGTAKPPKLSPAQQQALLSMTEKYTECAKPAAYRGNASMGVWTVFPSFLSLAEKGLVRIVGRKSVKGRFAVLTDEGTAAQQALRAGKDAG